MSVKSDLSLRTKKIDINCDLGEGVSKTDCDKDAKLMPFISRCNIACGGHAGNLETMRESLINAQENNLKIGAHPGYPDKENFGRTSLKLDFKQLSESLVNQVQQLIKVANSLSITLDHIKCHGALYNDAESNSLLSKQLVILFKTHFPNLKVMGLAGGEMEKSSHELNHHFLREGFMDRAYQSNGKLVPRTKPNSVFNNPTNVVIQACKLASGEPLQTSENQLLELSVDSICLHGDNPQALLIAKEVNHAISQIGIEIA